jgi:hypothetical protein
VGGGRGRGERVERLIGLKERTNGMLREEEYMSHEAITIAEEETNWGFLRGGGWG